MAGDIFVIVPLGELPLPVLVIPELLVARGYPAFSYARTGPKAGWAKVFGGPAIQSFGAGELLAVLARTMIPEDYEEGAPWQGW